MPSIAIDTYQVVIYSKRYNTSSNAAAIHMYNSSNTLVGSFYLNYDEGMANRAPVISGSRVIAYYHMSMLDSLVDLLRNEDTCYLFENVGSGLAYIATTKEEIGEEES